jgi:hypothetical protein
LLIDALNIGYGVSANLEATFPVRSLMHMLTADLEFIQKAYF